MDATTALAVRLSHQSVKHLWDVYSRIEWPDTLDDSAWFMPPELCSLYGTEAWEELDLPAQRTLSRYELGNFFSLTLQGERPLIQGLVNQMYSRRNPEVTEYIHHFLDEENKHMVMFADFCNRYVGKVYNYKKLVLPREYAKGEEDVTFFIKVLIVEELGDYYNIAMGRDKRLHPLVAEINNIHHADEARHITFGRRLLKDLFEEFAPTWSAETLAGLRSWLGDYMRSSWADFYNPSMYRDAAIPDAYPARQAALKHPACRAHRERASERLVKYFLDTGILEQAPEL
ncbi:MAG: diiron oxygenase [Proteobacteria bacterium]|nr:diiron oxygenase [Pseudomonadota bacterium]